MKSFPLIAVDFDGVMHDAPISEFPRIGKPKKGFVENFLKPLKKQGYKFFIYTSRSHYQEQDIYDWMKKYNLKSFIQYVICGKYIYTYFLDDRANFDVDNDPEQEFNLHRKIVELEKPLQICEYETKKTKSPE